MMKNFTGHCIPFGTFQVIAIIHGVVNALTDFIFALLPIGVLVKSQLPLATKIPACVVVGLAVLSSVASVVRVVYIPGLRPDATFYVESVRGLVWTVIEPGLGILAACLAAMRPLFRGCLEGVRDVVEAGSRTMRGKSAVKQGALDKDKGEIWVTASVAKASARISAMDKEELDEIYGLNSADLERGRASGGVVTTVVGNAGNEFEMVTPRDRVRR